MSVDGVSSVQGFKVVGLKFKEESKGIHQLLWKQHSVRTFNAAKPVERTLFVVNVPPYCTKEAFKRLFSVYGKVVDVFFHKKPSSGPPQVAKYPHFSLIPPIQGFKVAYVVFSHPSAIKKTLSVPPSTVLVLSTKEHPVLTGVQKWHQEYNEQFVKNAKLSEEIKALIEEYDKKRAEERAAAQQEPDDEGWVTVTSVKKKKPQLEKVDELKKKKKKKKKHQLIWHSSVRSSKRTRRE
ncbi:Ribosomal RNA-processing protein 7 A-like [Homarus americanus]|uniref:Ribosomal RNA-processing protein 7 A-like n=1 Tax=Homarus americanus TaxID=6706 RepID=A0A8J5N786_HOMAM|nr:Ribosomal RNA-processing protein 7 A-like [Homarus americanus]